MTRIAAGILAAALALAAYAEGPKFKIERGEACVAPTAEMRRSSQSSNTSTAAT